MFVCLFVFDGFCLQTRSLLGVFEEDTAAISNYCTQLYQAMQRIYDAQVHTHTLTHKNTKSIMCCCLDSVCPALSAADLSSRMS